MRATEIGKKNIEKKTDESRRLRATRPLKDRACFSVYKELCDRLIKLADNWLIKFHHRVSLVSLRITFLINFDGAGAGDAHAASLGSIADYYIRAL